MKKSLMAASLALAAGQAFGQWSDDFNRTSLGASWIANGGIFSNFFVTGNQGAHTWLTSDAMRYAAASGPYQLSTQTIDLEATPGTYQYVALGCGYGAGNNLYLKLQANTANVFDKIGFYSGLNASGPWAGAEPSFADLSATFVKGRMQVYFTDGGDTANVVVDTNFDGMADQAYARSGARGFMTGSGTGFGIGAFGEPRFDNWRIMPAIFPPESSIGYFLAPFGSGSTDVLHQVFRSGLWQTPVRITGVRYAPQMLGAWTGNVSIGFGYTSRTPGVVAPAGLDVPSAAGGGSPNAVGPLTAYFSGSALSENFVQGVAPSAENFQFAFNATPGFVYFPGMGNLLMETSSVVGATTDVGVSRGANGPDSSVAYSTTRFGSGSGVPLNSAPLVQFVAMPYTPEVLPTTVHVTGNAIPFASGLGLTHQVHHAGTIAPLGVGPGGKGKVAIQGLKYAPTDVSVPLQGQIKVQMGYSSRVPGVAAPAGLDIPDAGGGGAPNASGAMRQFMLRSMNTPAFTGMSPENFQIDLHQTPFVFDPAGGNLLIEIDSSLTYTVYASRTGPSPEAMRAYRTSGLGSLSDMARTTRVKFAATPVFEDVYPNHASDNGINVPFYPGVHVLHQVFSAAQFGSEPVRIDSIAYSAAAAANVGSDVTVRLGYTSRQPNQNAPVGLSVPDAGGDGVPNAAFGPMAVFRSGSLPIAVASVDPNVYQIVLKGDVPFLYNPAMGNLLMEVVSTANGALPVAMWGTATSGSSISLNSTTFGQGVYLSFAPLVKFTYFKDLYPCIADMTGDNVVDLNDFFAFFGCWDLTAPCADVDGTPGVDLNDFFAFLGSWDEGC